MRPSFIVIDTPVFDDAARISERRKQKNGATYLSTIKDKKETIYSGNVFKSLTKSFDASTPMGMAVFTFLSAIAQMERDVLKDIDGLSEGEYRAFQVNFKNKSEDCQRGVC